MFCLIQVREEAVSEMIGCSEKALIEKVAEALWVASVHGVTPARAPFTTRLPPALDSEKGQA